MNDLFEFQEREAETQRREERIANMQNHAPGWVSATTVERYRTREEWLAARRTFIGASESAALFGCGYASQSPITVYESKVNGTADESERQALRIGQMMEPALRRLFSEVTGLSCVKAGRYVVRRHPLHPWIGATLDAMTEDPEPVPVELKNVGHFNKRDWDDEPPLKFAIQLQHQLAVTGASHGYLFALIGGNEPVVKRMDRNERFIEAMIARLNAFWGLVQMRVLPEVDSSEATTKALVRLFDEEEGSETFLPDEAVEWTETIENARQQIKSLESIKDAAENKLRASIAEYSYGILPDGSRWQWKTQARRGCEVKPSSTRILRKVK